MNYKIFIIESIRQTCIEQGDLSLGEILYDVLRPGNNRKAKYDVKDIKALKDISDKEIYEAVEKYNQNNKKDD